MKLSSLVPLFRLHRTIRRALGPLLGILVPLASLAIDVGPTDIKMDSNVIYENESAIKLIGHLTTTETPQDAYTYTLVNGNGDDDNSSFTISDRFVALRAAQSFNFEAKRQYTVRIRSTNRFALWTEKSFTIDVLDVNDAPTDIKLTNYKILENQPAGTMVGALFSVDQDRVELNTYAFVDGDGNTDNSLFYISNKTVYTSIPFDYEAKYRFTVRLRCVDKGGLSIEKPVIITATDANETPTSLTLSNNRVAENQPVGTTVGTLGVTDPDAGQLFTYSKAVGKGDSDNASFTITNNKLRTASPFNFEGKTNYAIRLRVTDNGPSGGLHLEKTFVIAVTNMNEDPYGLSLSSSSVAENQPAGAPVGSFLVSDRDAGDTFVTALVAGDGSADNALFSVFRNKLSTAASFNFEGKRASLSIRARVTDKGGLTYEKALVISVTNVNEAPTGLALSNRFIEENKPAETVVGDFTATDPDSGTTFFFRLAPGAGDEDNAAFTLTGNRLYSAVPFDYESKSLYSIRVRAKDQGGLRFEKVFSIAVVDAIDPMTSLRVNCGGEAISNWASDFGFVSGIAITGAVPVANETVAPESVFRTARKGAPNLSYDFPLVPDGRYKVRFRLAELIANAEGRRVFNIRLEGVQVATNLDVFAAAGGKNKALTKTYTIDVQGGNGLQIDGESVTAAVIFNGIEMWPAGSGSSGLSPLGATLKSAALAPDRIQVSGSSGEFAEPWDLTDGDLATTWAATPDDGGCWVEYGYADTVSISDVAVFEETAGADIQFLGREDGGEWFDLTDELTGAAGLAEVDAIRVVMPPNENGAAPEIREIQVQGSRIP